MSSTDSRGVLRGACKISDCECDAYERGTGGNPCDYCGCMPTAHMRCEVEQSKVEQSKVEQDDELPVWESTNLSESSWADYEESESWHQDEPVVEPKTAPTRGLDAALASAKPAAVKKAQAAVKPPIAPPTPMPKDNPKKSDCDSAAKVAAALVERLAPKQVAPKTTTLNFKAALDTAAIQMSQKQAKAAVIKARADTRAQAESDKANGWTEKVRSNKPKIVEHPKYASEAEANKAKLHEMRAHFGCKHADVPNGRGGNIRRCRLLRFVDSSGDIDVLLPYCSHHAELTTCSRCGAFRPGVVDERLGHAINSPTDPCDQCGSRYAIKK